jgi:hypothetical protein
MVSPSIVKLEDIRTEELIHFVPAYYGANIDSAKVCFPLRWVLEGQISNHGARRDRQAISGRMG